MTTTPATPTTVADLAVGAVVTLPGKHRGGLAIVERVGACGYDRCKWGDNCVTVRHAGGFTSLNFPADQLTVVTA